MTKHASVYVCLCLYASAGLIAQTDSILMDEIKIFGIEIKSFTAGAKTETVDINSLSAGANLSALGENTSLFILNYGHNMLASVSMRGTGASRTAVLWNGININSKTLGQSDFNLLPTATSDELLVQYGSGSSLYGSDAIGGAISMNSKPTWSLKPHVSLTQTFGSFSTYLTTAKARISDGKLESTTTVHTNTSKNDFTFKNTTKRGAPIQKQQNASTSQHGLAQDIYYKINSNSLLSINSWYTNNKRNIQPQMFVTNSNEQIIDQNTRLLATYESNLKGNFITGRLGWIHDDELYNRQSSIETFQRIMGLEWNKHLSNHFTARAGVTSTRIKAEVTSYDEIIIEHRTDGFGSLRYTNNRFSGSFNIRKSWVTNTKAPLTPSIGFDYALNSNVSLRSQLAKNYRVPTLNDKYWPNLNSASGNLNIKPEYGYSAEIGANLKKSLGDTRISIDLSAYRLWVNDWITWTPSNGVVWTPENKDEVVSTGLEMNGNLTHTIGDFLLTANVNYALNTVLEKANNETESDRYLTYNPKNQLNINSKIRYKAIALKLQYQFIDKRFTNASNTMSLAPYQLTNVAIAHRRNRGKVNTQFMIQNIFNTVYQPQPQFAVPGRNYQVTVKVSI